MASFPNSRLLRMMVYTNFNASFLLHKISTLNSKHRTGLPNWKILDQTKELTVGEFNDLDSEQLSAGSTSYVLSLADGFQINVDSYNVVKHKFLLKGYRLTIKGKVIQERLSTLSTQFIYILVLESNFRVFIRKLFQQMTIRNFA